MKIVIFSGGTGSKALQKGLYTFADSKFDGVDTKIITNAYDNGKSTGVVRQVLGGEILGPSDVRKNQTTRLELENPKSPWLEFLEIRFSIEASNAQSYCFDQINLLASKLPETSKNALSIKLVKEAVQEYFSAPLAVLVDYNDFSIANIIYAGFAKANNNSLRKAASIMADILGIKDNVLLNSDKSLFLHAVTQSGKVISDESEIVSWNNAEDSIVDITFTNSKGECDFPHLNEECKKAIEEADLIILSTGTQWSSLIPTYASIGFKRCIEETAAEVIMVMNGVPDKDSPGQSSADIINAIVPKYFPAQKLNVILGKNSDILMLKLWHDDNTKSLLKSITLCDVLETHNTTEKTNKKCHNPTKLATNIAKIYFRDYLDQNVLACDYDDTLVGRGNSYSSASRYNIDALHMINTLYTNAIVCTGNSIKAVNLHVSSNFKHDDLKKITVYADGGINKYEYDACSDSENNYSFTECVDKSSLLGNKKDIQCIIDKLIACGIPYAKIENRGDAIISIKPISNEYRRSILSLVNYSLNDLIISSAIDLTTRLAGRTTVEISKKTLSKENAINSISTKKSITYIGDELESGNDECIRLLSKKNNNIKCLHVNNPVKTAFFLTTFLSYCHDKK